MVLKGVRKEGVEREGVGFLFTGGIVCGVVTLTRRASPPPQTCPNSQGGAARPGGVGKTGLYGTRPSMLRMRPPGLQGK